MAEQRIAPDDNCRPSSHLLRWLFGLDNHFPNEEVELYHHYCGDKAPKVNISECLVWLLQPESTATDVDQLKEYLMSNTLIQSLLDDLQKFAESTGVDTLDMLDAETWHETPYNFERARRLLWNAIAPCAAHQQRVENLLQTAGHLGKTHVEEERRSARAKIHSVLYRDLKICALDTLRQEDKQQQIELEEEERLARESGVIQDTEQQQKRKKQPKRMKVEGKRRLELHAQWIDEKSDEIEEAVAFLEQRSEGLMRTIKSEMHRDNKTSKIANEDTLKQYTLIADRQRDRRFTSKHVVDITPWMEGSVILSYILCRRRELVSIFWRK